MKYTAERYEGRNVGRYNHHVGVQIVAVEEEKRRYVFELNGRKTPCFKMWEGVAHYRSGLNAKDAKDYAEAMVEAKKLAEKWNKE